MTDLTLAVDVGNSRFKIGMFRRAAHDSALPLQTESVVVPLSDELPWDEILEWTSGGDVPRGVVAGSNPAGVRRVLETWPGSRWPLPVVVDHHQQLPLDVNLPFPGGVGLDRLLNAVAGNVLRSEGRPMVLVDSGTATTVDYVDSLGRFRGGAILPGFELSAKSLHQYTALLPYVEREELDHYDVPPLGTETREALRSGLYFGQLGAVRELVGRLKGVESGEATTLLTGGGSASLWELVGAEPFARVEPALTLQGLVLVADHLEAEARDGS